MLIVVALGGNALLRRGEPMTADTWLKRRHEAAPASPQVVDAVTPGRAIAVNAS